MCFRSLALLCVLPLSRFVVCAAALYIVCAATLFIACALLHCLILFRIVWLCFREFRSVLSFSVCIELDLFSILLHTHTHTLTTHTHTRTAGGRLSVRGVLRRVLRESDAECGVLWRQSEQQQ